MDFARPSDGALVLESSASASKAEIPARQPGVEEAHSYELDRPFEPRFTHSGLDELIYCVEKAASIAVQRHRDDGSLVRSAKILRAKIALSRTVSQQSAQDVALDRRIECKSWRCSACQAS